MKKGKLIIGLVVVALLLAFTVGVFKLKANVLELVAASEKKYEKKQVDMQGYTTIQLSGNWQVRILQAKTYKVQWGAIGNNSVQPHIEQRNDTLFLTLHADSAWREKRLLQAKITLPKIRAIKSEAHSSIYLAGFQDSLIQVDLADGCHFMAKNNTHKQLKLNTRGNVSLEFSASE